MNELLAIIIIVFLCCAMFFAWLISMATCPDRMVDLISGNTNQPGSSSSSTPTTSKELISDSNSPHTKRSSVDSAAPAIPNGKQKKKYSTAFLQLGAPFKQRRPADAPLAASRPNPKKLSVVPEQDEITIYSKTSQTQQQYGNSSVREPLIESASELPSLANDLPLIPFTIPIVIDMPAERCVEDVIDARRRQRQQQFQQQIRPPNQQQFQGLPTQDPFNSNTYSNITDNNIGVGFASEPEETAEDTIFLLPTCYDLLHPALTELDGGGGGGAERRASDAISLPNSPLASPLALPAPLPYHHNEYCHSETQLVAWPLTVVNEPTVQSAKMWPIGRRHSLSYIV